MFDHFQGYKKICTSRSIMQDKFFEYNIHNYPLFEKILGFQYELNQLVFPSYNRKYNVQDYKKQNIFDLALTESSVFNLCSYNIEYLSHAITPLEHNSVDVFECIIRPVYESIPKMFYMICHPEEIQSVVAKEAFQTWFVFKKYDCLKKNKSVNKIELIKIFLEEYQQTLPNIDVPSLEKLSQNNKKFNNAWYRKQIYSNQSLQLQDYGYGKFSNSVHANIIRSPTYKTYNKQYDEISMKILIDLSFFNLYILFNTCHKELEILEEKIDTHVFITEIQKELKYHLEITSLYPNCPDCIKNLILRPALSKP